MNVLLPLLKGNIVSGLAVECLSFFFFFPPKYSLYLYYIFLIFYTYRLWVCSHISLMVQFLSNFMKNTPSTLL